MDSKERICMLFQEFTKLPVRKAASFGGRISHLSLGIEFPCPFHIDEPGCHEQLLTVSGPYFHQFLLLRQAPGLFFAAGPYLPFAVTNQTLIRLQNSLSLLYPCVPIQILKKHYDAIPVLSRERQHYCLELMECIFRNDTFHEHEAPTAGDSFFSIIENNLALRRKKQLAIYDYYDVKLQLSQALLNKPDQILFNYLQHTFEFNIPDLIEGDPFRTRKNLSLTFLSLIVKTAIEEGLDFWRAFIVSDFYLVQIEKARSVVELDRLLFDAICQLSGELRMNRTPQFNRYLRHCLSYIKDNLSGPVRLEEVARHLGISPEHLSRLFSKEMGKSFSQYLLEVRMTEARRLLLFSGSTCADIAYLLGFSSHSHFVRTFKKHWGISPGSYRVQEGVINTG